MLQLPHFMDEYLKIPLSFIFKIDKNIVDKKINKNGISSLEIVTKDFRTIKFLFENNDDCANANLRIQLMAFPENELHDIFAFSYFCPIKDLEEEYLHNGWDIYKNPQEEFIRQGVTFTQVTLINSSI